MLASAGVKLENIPFVLRQVSLSAVAAATDTSTMFTGLNSVIQGYGYTLENIGIISDKFFKANAQGTLTIEGLSNSIGTVVPIANSARVSLDELLAAYATLTGVTGNEDEVATQLKGAINAIIAPSTEARKVLDSLGVEYGRNAIQAK